MDSPAIETWWALRSVLKLGRQCTKYVVGKTRQEVFQLCDKVCQPSRRYLSYSSVACDNPAWIFRYIDTGRLLSQDRRRPRCLSIYSLVKSQLPGVQFQ
jgi:hypothetical protein